MAEVLPIVLGDFGAPAAQPVDGKFPENGFYPEGKFEGKFVFDRTKEDGTYNSLISEKQLLVPGQGVFLSSAVSLGKHVSISSSLKAGIGTLLRDAQAMTYGGVFWYDEPEPAESQQCLAGTRSDTIDGGEILRVNNGGWIILEIRGFESVLSISVDTLRDAGITRSGWVFVMKTAKALTDGETEHTLFVGSPNGPLTVVDAGIKVPSSQNVRLAIGNAHRDGVFALQNIRCASFVYGVEYVSVDEMNAFYRMQKVMMKRRGVNIF